MKTSALITAGISLFALTGCASIGLDRGDDNGSSGNASAAVEETRDGIGDAILTPVDDLNLRDREIPEALARIDNPYALETARDCTLLSAELDELNAVLGRDADDDSAEEEAGARRRDAAGATLGFVSSTASGIIPFRGLVRYASGASEADQQVIAAYLRGHQRRGFLRGISMERGC